VPGGRVWSGPACDDLRLAGLKLVFLVVTRAVAVLGLSRREAWWKDAEILMLRHQLAVAQREQPRAHSRLTWPDRAWLALLAGTLPAGHLAELRLIEQNAVLEGGGVVLRRGPSGTCHITVPASSGIHFLGATASGIAPGRRPPSGFMIGDGRSNRIAVWAAATESRAGWPSGSRPNRTAG
jgi:hypothetical protein